MLTLTLTVILTIILTLILTVILTLTGLQGQLGHGDERHHRGDHAQPWQPASPRMAVANQSRLTPFCVEALEEGDTESLARVLSVACGNAHTLVEVTNSSLGDQVRAFGDNDYGQLGLGDRQSRSLPETVVFHR